VFTVVIYFAMTQSGNFWTDPCTAYWEGSPLKYSPWTVTYLA